MARRLPRALVALPVAAVGFLAGQVYRAGHRSDLPSHANQETSGTFGSPDLPTLRMVALGDSSITCPGVADVDHCFIRRVAAHLSDRYFVDLRSVAVGGSKVSDVLNHQLDLAMLHRPDLAIVSVGSNDAIRATPARLFERQLEEIVVRLLDVSQAVAVMGVGDLGTIPRLPWSLRPMLSTRARNIDRAVSRVVERHDRVARAVTWGFVSDVFMSGDPALWAGDRFHASDRGHAVFASSVISTVESLLPLVDTS